MFFAGDEQTPHNVVMCLVLALCGCGEGGGIFIILM